MPFFKKSATISLSFDAAADSLEEKMRGNLKRKVGAHKWEEKYFVLYRSGTLSWFKDETSYLKGRSASFSSKSNSLKANKKQIGTFLVSGGANWKVKMSDEVDGLCLDAPNSLTSFQICEGNNVHLSFCANDDLEYRNWIVALKSVIAGDSENSTPGSLSPTSSSSKLATSAGGRASLASPPSAPLSPRNMGHSMSRASNASRESLQFNDEVYSIVIDADDIEIENTKSDRMNALWTKPNINVTVWEVEDAEKWPKDKWKVFHAKAFELSKLEPHDVIEKFYVYCRMFVSQLYLVGERFEGESLNKILTEAPYSNNKLEWTLQIRIATEICKSLILLHDHGLSYDDLSASRITLEEQNIANSQTRKIKLDPVGIFQTPSVRYASPEFLKTGPTPQNTVFQFGLLLYEIVMQTKIWPELKDEEVGQKLAKKERPAISKESPWKAIVENCWDHNPESRFTLTQILSELERVREMLEQQQIRLRERDVNLFSKEDKIGETISAIFISRPQVTWAEFRSKFAEKMEVSGMDLESLDDLKFIFCTEGMVGKQIWEAFLLWFSPLSAKSHYEEENDENPYENGTPKQEGHYENASNPSTPQLAPVVVKINNKDNDKKGLWDLDSIKSICCKPWFHGFMESTTSQKELKDKPVGTFLIRFSLTTPGMYALSVVKKTGFYHGRIECSKTPGKSPEFRLDGKDYSSLDELIEKHKTQPLVSKTGESFYLETIYERRM